MNVFCIYNISVRCTIIEELQPFIRLVIRTPATRLQGRPWSKLMVPLERASMSFYLKVSTKMTYDAPFLRYSRLCAGTIFRYPSRAQWGRRSPKVKVDLDPPGMGSYSTLIVTMGLSSTVNSQYTPRQTDRRTDMLLTIAHPML